jgi:hypothetical protein
MYAARRNSGMLILKLIEMGADYTLEDKEGNNALSYAKKRSMQNSDIITYLETLQSLHTAIFSDEKRNEHHPIHQVLKDIDKTMHLDKPFYKGKTALMCAAEFKNPFLLNSILDKLENLGIDEPSIPAAHTALFVSARCGNFANAIELLKCGANPALVTKHPDFSEFVDNDNIIYLLEKWQDPPTLKAVLENIISTLQQFELTSKDTQNLEKELIIGLESKESNVIFNTIIKLFEKIDFTIYIDDFDEFPIIQIYKEIYDSIESDKVSASYSPVYLIDPIPKIDTLDSFPFEENDTNIGPTPMSVLNDLASLINSYEEGVEIEDTFDSVNSPRNTFVYFPDEVPVLPASEIPNFQSGGSSRRRSIFAEPITPASQYESDQENIDSIQMNSPR